IGVMGGGATLSAISGGVVPFWFGGALVALVVMSYVFFGGMRGTAWVNTFQTVLFLCFGAIAFVVIGVGMGGFGPAMRALLASPRTASPAQRSRPGRKPERRWPPRARNSRPPRARSCATK